MANQVTTGTAGGALRGGMLGGVTGFFTIPVMAAAAAALVAWPLGAAAATIGATAGIVGLATTFAGALPFMPFNWTMAAYGAAGGGLFGAANGAEKGLQGNVQEQARSAYVNAYAQTRAQVDQMAMAQPAPMMDMQNVAFDPRMAANDDFPMAKASPQIDAASIQALGQGVEGEHQIATANERV